MLKKFMAIPGALLMLALGSCGSSDRSFSTSELDEFLKIEAVNAIELEDDGSEPVTEGNWKRYSPDTTWNWQLNGTINHDFDANVYVLDLFTLSRTDDISKLHALGRDVICNFSAGTFEHWRPDSELFSGVAMGNSHIGFADEKWLDFSTLDEQRTYFQILANEVHRRGMSVALKNNVEILSDVADYFDVLINEECFQHQECDGYLPVVQSGKPLFNAEYSEIHVNDIQAREELCAVSRDMGFQTLILPLALDGSFRFSCQ